MKDDIKINELNLINSFRFNFMTRTVVETVRLILLYLQINKKLDLTVHIFVKKWWKFQYALQPN